MPTQDWTLPGADDQPIHGTTHLPEPQTPARGSLLVCHGFRGYKDYGFLPVLAESAARLGLIAHRFNFSHSGITRNPESFDRPDLFQRDTYGKQVHDLVRVAHAATTGSLPGGRHPDRPCFWFGHSRGGVVVLLTAARAFATDPPPAGLPQPAGIIAASAPHQACWLDEDQVQTLRSQGYLETPSARTGQMLRIGAPWLEQIEQNPDDFDPVTAARRTRCHLLVVHGQNDQTISTDSARHLASAGSDRAQLVLIPNASHTFNAPNPMSIDDEPPPPTRQLIRAVLDFVSNLC